MRVLISILCGPERHNWLNPGLVKWIVSQNVPPGMEVELAFEENLWPVSHARNAAANRGFLKSSDWSVQIDNDEVPPDGFLWALRAAEAKKLDVLGIGAFALVGECRIPIPNINKRDSDGVGADDDKDFEEVGKIGGGCFSIHRRVLEKLPRPWFRLDFDEETGMTKSEDLQFCLDARSAGFRIWTAKGLTAKHYKTVELSEYFANLRELSADDMNKVQREILPVAPWAKAQSA